MKKLIEADKWLFTRINRDSANGLFDQVLPLLRISYTWLPFYVFLFIYVVINFKKKALPFVLFAASTGSVTDLISSRIIKPGIGRLRPCNDESLSHMIRLLGEYCGGNGSFTSSHAANHFGLAMFLFLTMQSVWGKWCYLFFAWAAIICFAQVYIGVHFPLDIIGGGIFGCIIGGIAGKIFNKVFGSLHNDHL
jgi:undecaprenyl-diphosphatase